MVQKIFFLSQMNLMWNLNVKIPTIFALYLLLNGLHFSFLSNWKTMCCFQELITFVS